MNEEALLADMTTHLAESGGAGVLYLEGLDDPHNLAALLGVQAPQAKMRFTLDHILVVGLDHKKRQRWSWGERAGALGR